MTKRKAIVVYVLGLLLVLLLWQQVFAMTGVLWWNAPQPARRLPAFQAVQFTSPDTRQVDLDAFLQTHPVWNPR